MGFLNKLMGLNSIKSESKKDEIRNIFNSKVKDGEKYTVLAGMNMITSKKLLKEIRTYYNYIIGYCDSDDPEIVIISTDSELSFFEEPVYCKKSECISSKYIEQMGTFTIEHPKFDEPLTFFIISSTAWGGYVINVSYVGEFETFVKFFKKSFEK